MTNKTMNLRQAIVERVKEKSEDQLVEILDDSIGNDERTLPGLGVLFEIIWQHINDDTRRQLAKTLKDHLAEKQS